MRAYKPINIILLEKELIAAGITVNGLGMEDDEIFTYDEHGSVIDLPTSAQAVIDLHEYESEPQPPTEIEKLRLEQAQANSELVQLIMLVNGGVV